MQKTGGQVPPVFVIMPTIGYRHAQMKPRQKHQSKKRGFLIVAISFLAIKIYSTLKINAPVLFYGAPLELMPLMGITERFQAGVIGSTD